MRRLLTTAFAALLLWPSQAHAELSCPTAPVWVINPAAIQCTGAGYPADQASYRATFQVTASPTEIRNVWWSTNDNDTPAPDTELKGETLGVTFPGTTTNHTANFKLGCSETCEVVGPDGNSGETSTSVYVLVEAQTTGTDLCETPHHVVTCVTGSATVASAAVPIFPPLGLLGLVSGLFGLLAWRLKATRRTG